MINAPEMNREISNPHDALIIEHHPVDALRILFGGSDVPRNTREEAKLLRHLKQTLIKMRSLASKFTRVAGFAFFNAG